MNNYDIFISYRREGGYDTAKHLYDLLARDKYSVSFDIDTLRNGDFDISLLQRIDRCRDFILIVDKNAFDRTVDPNFDPMKDWLRQELAFALSRNKNIIPIFLNGVSGFPDNLPADVAAVAKKNGPEYNRYYFNDFYETLKKRFLTAKPRGFSRFGKGLLVAAAVVLMVLGAATLLDFGNGSGANITGATEAKTQVGETDMRTKLKKFCGSFTYTIPNAGFGGINYVFELVLDPLNSSVNMVEEGIVNITNSKGYYGTMMQWPEYWEVVGFNLNKNGDEAIVQMIGGDNNICDVRLRLDDYNNIEMSFISGNEGPGILMDGNGNYTSKVIFRREAK